MLAGPKELCSRYFYTLEFGIQYITIWDSCYHDKYILCIPYNAKKKTPKLR